MTEFAGKKGKKGAATEADPIGCRFGRVKANLKMGVLGVTPFSYIS
jgi:hypothetical protein